MRRDSSPGLAAQAVPPLVHEVLGAPGRALEAGTRAFMEPRFGHDFSRVRVHADARAAQSARAVNAQAFTFGRDIVFDQGRYAPTTREGRQLLAHELAHVVQQGEQAGATPVAVGDSQATAETEADRAAGQVLAGAGLPALPRRPPALQRKLNVDKPKTLIDNPTGTGLVQSNAVTVLGYLQTLCSSGAVKVDAGSGDVSLGAGFCQDQPLPPGFEGPPIPSPALRSTEKTGCGCLCDMVGSVRQWTIRISDTDWPNTTGQVVTIPSPNSELLYGAATASGKAQLMDPWLVLGHELCGHAWLDETKSPVSKALRGEGGHQEAIARENEVRKEHKIEERGDFKAPYCGESFSQEKAGPGPVEWSVFLQKCKAWRNKRFGNKYKISDRIP
jgi:hypothetical protein